MKRAQTIANILTAAVSTAALLLLCEGLHWLTAWDYRVIVGMMCFFSFAQQAAVYVRQENSIQALAKQLKEQEQCKEP